MILDSFKIHSAIIQIQYADAFLIWDRAGEIGRELSKIWDGLKVAEGQPQQQILVGEGVNLQTGFSKSTITISGEHALGQLKVGQIIKTFEVWRNALELAELTRVSTRVVYSKEFASMESANAGLFALNLVQWPDTKVFDQPLESDKNGLEILYRFEDDKSFSLLKLKAEQVKYEVDLDENLFGEKKMEKIINRMTIDFDRGLLGSVNAEKFRMDEWLKGYQHILRRDIEKVLKIQI
jgi:hypothetical protein